MKCPFPTRAHYVQDLRPCRNAATHLRLPHLQRKNLFDLWNDSKANPPDVIRRRLFCCQDSPSSLLPEKHVNRHSDPVTCLRVKQLAVQPAICPSHFFSSTR